MVHTRVPCTHEAAIHAPYSSTQNHYGERETEKERQRERKGEGRRHAPALVAACYNVEAHEQNERWTTVIQSSTSVPYVSWLLSSSCDIVFVHIRPRFPASTIRLPESRQLTRTGTKNIGKNDALNVIIAFTPDIYFPMIFLYDALIEDRH